MSDKNCTTTPIGVFTILLCLSIAALLVYRAMTMSMTTDEAFTVSNYAAQGRNIFSPEKFWPNNHIPHSILVWVMFQIAPWQEWAMRLPALAAGIGVLVVLRQLGYFLFVTTPEKPGRIAKLCPVLLIAVVALHPLVFQFLSFARGYGLSLLCSLLGFYTLLLVLCHPTGDDEVKRFRCNMSIAGILFGSSVAANLTSAIMNVSMVVGFLVVAVCSNRFHTKQLQAFLLLFCLPGAGIALVPYAPVIFRVSLARFDYATDNAWEGLLDPVAYTLGRCDVVPEVNRLLIGVPVSEETYWLLLTAMPFVVVLPIVLIASVFAAVSFRTIKIRPLRPDESALLVILLGLFCYTAILCIAAAFGKHLFPKDRTGVLPIAYASMLPVLLLYRFEVSAALRRFGYGVAIALLLYMVHLTSLFAYPYYHNIWYADADIRTMMQDVRKRMTEPEPPRILVCLAMNEPVIEYYKKKYVLNDLQVERILRTEAVEDISAWPSRVFFILPAHEAEATVRRQAKSLEILRRNPYTGLVLMECAYLR